MPSEITAGQMDLVKPYLEAVGVPASLQPTIFQAIDAAGFTVVDKTTGTPAPVLDKTAMERVQVEGQPNTYLVGVRVGERGWMAWVETMEAGGLVTRTPPVFSAGAGSLLFAPQTSGLFTVGTSLVAGSDKVG